MAGRPPADVPRPHRIAIRDNLVQCRHINCNHVAGPYPNRDETALAALKHYEARHQRGTS
jgi:hypothetical protein